VDAAYHVVSVLASVLTPLLGGLAAAAAIVLFTIGVRVLLLPLSFRVTRGMAAQARIAPRVRALQKQHAGQPDRLQRELSALYQAEGTSMFAGCLPMLAQWPFLSVMYLLFRSAEVGGTANSLLTHNLFGAPLGSHWLGGAGPLSAQGAVFAGLFALIAGVGWLSTRLAARLTAPRAEPTRPAQSAKAAQAARAPALLAGLTPLITVVMAAFVPLAAGLYLLTTTTWTLAERTLSSVGLPRGRSAWGLAWSCRRRARQRSGKAVLAAGTPQRRLGLRRAGGAPASTVRRGARRLRRDTCRG
jgi:YidC/Oxa1 family membrane protein insertase